MTDFDRSKHTLKATRDFQRGPISAKRGDALTEEQMAALTDDDAKHLIGIAQVAEPIGIGTKTAKAAEAKAAKKGKAEAPPAGDQVDAQGGGEPPAGEG